VSRLRRWARSWGGANGSIIWSIDSAAGARGAGGLVDGRLWRFDVEPEFDQATDGIDQYVPVNGSTRCKMAPRQMSTTSNLSRFDSRRSLANLSMAQKQIAPMTTIIKTPIKTEIIPIPFAVDYSHHHTVARPADARKAPVRAFGNRRKSADRA
jgi:hypothetical protein